MSSGAGSDSEPAHSRRELLGGASAGLLAGGMLLAGCGGSSPKKPITPAPPPPRKISHGASVLDVEILNGLLEIEHMGIAAYTASVPLLHGHTQRAARDFLKAELNHAGELGDLIGRHGGKAVKARPSYDLGSPQSTDEVLRLLERVELRQIAGYLDAIPRVQPGAMRASLASILGSEAQHITIVRTALGEPPLRGAFVTAHG